MIKTETFHVQAKMYEGQTYFYVMQHLDMSQHGYVYVKPIPIEYEIPDDFDIRPLQVKALDTQMDAVRAEFSKRIMELQDEKAKLLCIEMVEA